MYIWSEEELKKFINLLPNLEEGNIYFLSLSARKKYLTEEEREFFDLGRTEMFGRRLTSKENYIKTVKELDDFACNYTTRNEKIIPGKSLVFYANINPSSGLQAAEMFNNELNKLVFDSFFDQYKGVIPSIRVKNGCLKKGDVITVTQSIEQRLELNRPIEGLEVYRENEVYVWKLNFQQVLEEAYRLFKKEAKKQTTLFDFIAAA